MDSPDMFTPPFNISHHDWRYCGCRVVVSTKRLAIVSYSAGHGCMGYIIGDPNLFYLNSAVRMVDSLEAATSIYLSMLAQLEASRG